MHLTRLTCLTATACVALLGLDGRAQETADSIDWIALRAELLERATRGDERTDDFSRVLEAWYQKLDRPIVISHPRENGAYFMPLVVASAPEDKFPIIQQRFAADDLPNRRQVFERAVERFAADLSPLPFDREAWAQAPANGRQRYRLLKSFLEQHPPVGVSPTELRQHLGAPDTESESHVAYRIGQGPQVTGIDPMLIVFVVEKGRITSFHFQAS